MGKVLVILIDGLSLRVARRCMSFMQAMTMAGKMRLGQHQAFLPPLSRPAYATLLSGKTPLEHGVLGNENRNIPLKDTFFHRAASAGFRTAAASYGWFYELCVGGSFNPAIHRWFRQEQAPIQEGLFYGSDSYPDREAFADAEALSRERKPDLLLLHSMGVDWAGHNNGACSCQYRDAVRNVDALLAEYLPHWLDEGYSILITGDHGMDEEGRHYDVEADCRDIPCWLGGDWQGQALPESPLQIKPYILSLLGLRDDMV